MLPLTCPCKIARGVRSIVTFPIRTSMAGIEIVSKTTSDVPKGVVKDFVHVLVIDLDSSAIVTVTVKVTFIVADLLFIVIIIHAPVPFSTLVAFDSAKTSTGMVIEISARADNVIVTPSMEKDLDSSSVFVREKVVVPVFVCLISLGSILMTSSVTFFVCVISPLLPVIVSVYDPPEAEAGVAIVSVDVPLGVTVCGLKEGVMPVGNPETVRWTEKVH